jgi:hypothetical protein
MFKDLNEIKNMGFIGFKSNSELFLDCSVIPKQKGVYLVLYVAKEDPKFLDVGTGGFFKSKNPNVSRERLRSSWVLNSLVVYIGKAGGTNSSATLYSRLKQYFSFGQGKAVGHYGGRYIWQLERPQELIVCWKPTPNDEPRGVENLLISQFVKEFGKRPFANLAD